MRVPVWNDQKVAVVVFQIRSTSSTGISPQSWISRLALDLGPWISVAIAIHEGQHDMDYYVLGCQVPHLLLEDQYYTEFAIYKVKMCNQ